MILKKIHVGSEDGEYVPDALKVTPDIISMLSGVLALRLPDR